jgi:hypothetical protein
LYPPLFHTLPSPHYYRKHLRAVIFFAGAGDFAARSKKSVQHCSS